MNSLAANMASKLLSRYVEGITKDKLDVNVFSGDLVLTNAKIRKSALEDFDLPFDVTRGVVDKLTLRVPWAHLKTKRAELLVDGVKLLATPRDPRSRTWSAEEEHRRNQERKMERLTTFEDMRASKEGRSGGAGWSAKLMELVISNIKIEVKNVHLRFEDTMSDPSSPYALGLVWDSMSLSPTTDEWEPVFLTELGSRINKQASLKQFLIYTRANRMGTTADLSPQDWNTYMTDLEAISGGDQGRIITPLDLTVKMSQLTYAGLEDDSLAAAPLLESLVTLSSLSGNITKDQYDCLLRLVNMLTLFSVAWEHALLRPDVGVGEGAREWWRFAKTCIVRSIRKARVSHDRMKEGKKLIKEEYVFVWKMFVKGGRKVAGLPKKWKSLLTLYEEVLPALDLISYRVIAYRILDAERKREKLNPTAQGSSTHKKASWFQKITAKAKRPTLPQDDVDMKIVRGVKLQPHKTSSRRKIYSIEVKECVLVLKPTVTGEPLAKCVMKGLHLDLSDTKIDCTVLTRITDLTIEDSKPGAKWKTVLGPDSDGGQSSTLSILSAYYAFMKPASKLSDEKGLVADTSLTLQTSRPLRLIFNVVFLERLIMFFKPPPGWSILSSDLGVTPADFNTDLPSTSPRPHRTTKSLPQSIIDALEERHTSDVKIIAAAPTVIIPRDCLADQTEALVCNLGQLRVTSRLHLLEKAALRKRARANACEEDDTHEWWDIGVRGMKVGIRPCSGCTLLPATHGTDVLCETGAHLVFGSSFVPKRQDVPVIITRGRIGPTVRVKINHASLATVSEISAQVARVLYGITVGDDDKAGSEPPSSAPSSRQASPVASQSSATGRGAAAAASIHLETEMFKLELALAPTGSGERPAACIVNIADMKSTVAVPRCGYTAVSGEASAFTVTAHDRNDTPAVIMTSKGKVGKPLFSYTTDDADTMMVKMNLSEPVINPVPEAVRHAMCFFAPFAVGVPVEGVDVLSMAPDAKPIGGDLLVTESCVLDYPNIGFGKGSRLLVKGQGTVVIEGLGDSPTMALIEGVEPIIIVSQGCTAVLKGWGVYCKREVDDYVMKGQGVVVMEGCVLHSEVGGEATGQWRPYHCAVDVLDGRADLPDGYKVQWESFNWSYAWDTHVVTSAFGCSTLRVTANEVQPTNMLSRPLSMSYRTAVTQISPTKFSGQTVVDIGEVSLRTSTTDFIGLNRSLGKIHESVYPPGTSGSVEWSDKSVISCEKVTAAVCGTQGGAANLRLTCHGVGGDVVEIEKTTVAVPKHPATVKTNVKTVVKGEVWCSAAREWVEVLNSCRLSVDSTQEPCGLLSKTGLVLTGEDPLQLTISDSTTDALKAVLEADDDPAKTPTPQPLPTIVNLTMTDCIDATYDEAGNITLHKASTPQWVVTPVESPASHPVVGYAKYTALQNFASIAYFNIKCPERPMVEGDYHLVPLITYEKYPVWTTQSGRGMVCSEGGRWVVKYSNKVELVSGLHEGVKSPLEGGLLEGAEVVERHLTLREVEFRAKAFGEVFSLSDEEQREIVHEKLHIDVALHLKCVEMDVPSSGWVGYRPSEAVRYVLEAFYAQHDPHGMHKIAALVEHVVDGVHSAEKILEMLCGKWGVDSEQWTWEYPKALQPSKQHCEEPNQDHFDVMAGVEQKSEDLAAWAMGEGCDGDTIIEGNTAISPLREWVEVEKLDIEKFDANLIDSVLPDVASPPRPTQLWNPLLKIPEEHIPIIIHNDQHSLTGPIFFHNKTSLSVHVQCGETVTTLPPNMTTPTPASLTTAFYLLTYKPIFRFMLFGAVKRKRSDSSVACTISKHEFVTHEEVGWSDVCSIPHEGDVVEASHAGKNVLVKSSIDTCMCLEFSSGLNFHNELPFAVTLQLVGGGVKSEVVVGRDCSVTSHDYPLETEVFVVVKVSCPATGVSRTSPPMQITPMTASVQLPLTSRGNAEDSMPVHVEVNRTELGGVDVALTSPLWVMNATTFPVNVGYGGVKILLPEGTPIPYGCEEPLEVESVVVAGRTEIVTNHGAVMNVVVKDKLVMLTPVAVVGNGTGRKIGVELGGSSGRVVPGGSYFSKNKISVGADMTIWDETVEKNTFVTFPIPSPSRPSVIRLHTSWVLAATHHDDETNTTHITLGGRLPPSPLTITNHNWHPITAGAVTIPPFASSPVYFDDDEGCYPLPLRLSDTDQPCIIQYTNYTITAVVPSKDVDVIIDVRHKGSKDVHGSVYVYGKDVVRCAQDGDEVARYEVRFPEVSVAADFAEVGNVVALRGRSPSGEVRVGVDGGVRLATAALNDVILDSHLLRDIVSTQACKIVPFGVEVVDRVFPLSWVGTPLASFTITDLPSMDADVLWRSPVGLKILCEAIDLDCTSEMQSLTTYIMQEAGDNASLSDIASNSGKHLAALKGNDQAAMRIGYGLGKALVSRKVGVDIDKVQDGDTRHIADIVFNYAAKSQFEGSARTLLLSAGKHLQLVERAHTLYNDPTTPTEAKAILESMLSCETKAELLEAAARLTQHLPELTPLVDSLQETALDMPTTIEAVTTLLGLAPNGMSLDMPLAQGRKRIATGAASLGSLQEQAARAAGLVSTIADGSIVDKALGAAGMEAGIKAPGQAAEMMQAAVQERLPLGLRNTAAAAVEAASSNASVAGVKESAQAALHGMPSADALCGQAAELVQAQNVQSLSSVLPSDMQSVKVAASGAAEGASKMRDSAPVLDGLSQTEGVADRMQVSGVNASLQSAAAHVSSNVSSAAEKVSSRAEASGVKESVQTAMQGIPSTEDVRGQAGTVMQSAQEQVAHAAEAIPDVQRAKDHAMTAAGGVASKLQEADVKESLQGAASQVSASSQAAAAHVSGMVEASGVKESVQAAIQGAPSTEAVCGQAGAVMQSAQEQVARAAEAIPDVQTAKETAMTAAGGVASKLQETDVKESLQGAASQVLASSQAAAAHVSGMVEVSGARAAMQGVPSVEAVREEVEAFTEQVARAAKAIPDVQTAKDTAMTAAGGVASKLQEADVKESLRGAASQVSASSQAAAAHVSGMVEASGVKESVQAAIQGVPSTEAVREQAGAVMEQVARAAEAIPLQSAKDTAMTAAGGVASKLQETDVKESLQGAAARLEASAQAAMQGVPSVEALKEQAARVVPDV